MIPVGTHRKILNNEGEGSGVEDVVWDVDWDEGTLASLLAMAMAGQSM